MTDKKKHAEIPEVESELRSNLILVPEKIQLASGINILGRNIKSLIFSTDVAIIRNNNADAVLSVYPFTPQPAITKALMYAASTPIFCGVGGGLTGGQRVMDIALDAEFQGASGVVLNEPSTNQTVEDLKKQLEIPVILTVCHEDHDVKSRVDAGVDIFNVSAGIHTLDLIKKIKDIDPLIPIIATGGQDDDTLVQTIEAGANAITYTPPTSPDLLREIMKKYRAGEHNIFD